MKKLSIVTPSYKSEKYLESYFENIISTQGFSNYEIILILNKPTEKELEISANYKAKYPDNIKIVEVPLESIGASTNRGFLMAETEFITCADVDDVKVKDCFSRQLETLEANPEAGVTYGDFKIVSGQGVTEGLRVNTVEFTKDRATRGSIVGPNHFFRKKLLEKCGLWDEQFRSGSDFDFQVREAFNTNFKKTGGDILLYYTRYEGSNSASSGRLQQVERTVIQLRYGIYDKINYVYLPEALKYDIFNIYSQGQKRPVSDFVPNYQKYLQDCAQKYLKKGIRRNFVDPVFIERLTLVTRSMFKNPIWTINKIYSKWVK